MYATPQSKSITSPFVPFLAVPRKRGDEACANLSPRAFKVWYHITRMTCGWHREEAAISYSEFKRACGIKASTTISAAIKELVSKGYVQVVKDASAGGWHLASIYSLVIVSAETPPAAPPPPPSQPAWRQEAPAQERGNTPPAPTSARAVAGVVPPAPPPRQPAPQAAPIQAKEPWRAPERSTFPGSNAPPAACEETAVETLEVTKKEVTEEESASRSPLEELQRQLAELTRQACDAYYLMSGGTYGTEEYEARKQRLKLIRVDQQRVRALMHHLEG
ncbi:MAG TPA: helix-turn-helix domain-containing protein [Ktedonobacterales bacterium]